MLYKKELEEVLNSNIDDWVTDQRKGLHCSNCYTELRNKLLNNSTLPRMLCIRCLRNILLDTSLTHKENKG